MTEVERVVGAYFERLNAEEWESLLELFHIDAELRAPGTKPRRGREAIADYFRRALAPYPEHRDEPVRVIASGDTAAVEIRYSGRTAEGRSVSFDAVDIFDIEDGQIRTLTSWYDLVDVRAQLGR